MVQPYVDNFLIACACDIIEQFAPEVMFVHDGIMDGTRHKYGASTVRPTGIEFVDKQFGLLMDALKRAGVYGETNIVVISDHGQLDTKRIMKPNVYLRDHGFITTDECGNVVDWKASLPLGCDVGSSPSERSLRYKYL